MKVGWLVIANSAKADIYGINLDLYNQNKITLIKTFESEASKIKISMLEDDQSGQFGFGIGGHTYSHNDPHQDVVKSFAKQVAEYIDTGRTGNQFEQLFLVADPAFIGLLFGLLSANTQELVKAKINKNYIHTLDNKEIELNDIINMLRDKRQ